MLPLDFEYNASHQRDMGLVSVAVDWGKTAESIWLRRPNTFKEQLMERKGETIVCFNTLAEARGLIALGIDPYDFKWVDLWLDYRQLQNNDNRHEYGRQLVEVTSKLTGKKSVQVQSSKAIPPIKGYVTSEEFDKHQAKYRAIYANMGFTTKPVNASLLNASLNFLSGYTPEQAKRDYEVKRATIDLIINQDSWTKEEEEQILAYGASDVSDLLEMSDNMASALEDASHQSAEDVHKARLWRGDWGVACAVMESNGTPLSEKRLGNLERNAQSIVNKAKASLNMETGIDFCQWTVKGKAKKKPRWDNFVVKKDVLIQYITEKGWLPTWPRNAPTALNPQGSLKLDSDNLKTYKGDWVIDKYLTTTKTAQAMSFYRNVDDGKRRVRDCLGSDNRLRCALFPLGTQTGRNAPKASNYIYAQGRWVKSLIEVPKGKWLVETDYSSQEVFISAILSKDKAMEEAYKTDVYLSFGVWAKVIPEQYRHLPWDEMKKTCKEIRDKILKPIVLGIGYGAGAKTISLSVPDLPFKEVERLVEAYKARYATYYRWRDRVLKYHRYSENPPIAMSKSGWYLGKDADNALSIQNWPVQTTGSEMLQYLAPNIIKGLEGVELINTLHDATYYLVDEGDYASIKAVEDVMLEASAEVLGQEGMRVESEHWAEGDILSDYTPEWQKFKEYIQ